MAEDRLITLGGIMGSEWRTYRRSPVCLIGLAAVGGVMFSEGRSPVGWPSANMSLDSFQLTASLLVGIVSFLLAAGSLARDLASGRRQLVFSRPIPTGIYLAGKLAAAISFGWGLVGLLLVFSLCRPLFHGVWTTYPPGPFLMVTVLCGLPMVVYSCCLAMFLTALCGGRVIVALPVFLLYFFGFAILRLGGGGEVDYLDFSMRLYGQFITLEVPIWLTDVSFSHLLDPVRPGLIYRCLLYVAWSVFFAVTAGYLIARLRDARWRWRVRPRDRNHGSNWKDGGDGTRVFSPN